MTAASARPAPASPALAAPRAPGAETAPVVEVWPQAPASVPGARRALRETLTAWRMEALADDAELVLAELVTNAIEHCRPGAGHIETWASVLPGRAGVRLEVHDPDAYRMPSLAKPLDDQVRGRGLQLVDALTKHMWGVTTRAGAPGKLVWAHVGAEARTDGAGASCHAYTRVGPALAADVFALAANVTLELVARTLLCVLERGHPGDHFGLVYDHLDGPDAGAVWSRWTAAPPLHVTVLPDCPDLEPSGSSACCLFAAHAGRHTWEWTS